MKNYLLIALLIPSNVQIAFRPEPSLVHPINISTGVKIGAGFALCSNKEKTKKQTAQVAGICSKQPAGPGLSMIHTAWN